MSDAHPLVITSNEIECTVLRKAFGSSALVVVAGWFIGSWRASCIIVTSEVRTGTDWFQTAVMPRLMPGGAVYSIKADWHAHRAS